MDNQIMYEITHKDGLLELHSVVETKFGGVVKNYVKNAAFASVLRNYAHNQGWIEYKPVFYTL